MTPLCEKVHTGPDINLLLTCFVAAETTLLVQDAQLLSCTEVSGLEQEVDEVTRKMQIVLSHFNYDHTQVIAAVLNIGGVLSGFAC